MTLKTSVYSAYRGYHWSQIPAGTTEAQLNTLFRSIAAARGDFPDPVNEPTSLGVVSDGKIAAAFNLQNVEKWDAQGRASDYAALAFFTLEEGKNLDFVSLVNQDFFWTPTRKPPLTIEYNGPRAAAMAPLAGLKLLRHNTITLKNPSSVGSILAEYGTRSDRWLGTVKADGSFKLECNPWIRKDISK